MYLPVASLDLSARAESIRIAIAIERSPEHFLEADGHEDPEIPAVYQLRSQQEHTVEQEDHVLGRDRRRIPPRSVSPVVEHGWTVLSASAWAERTEQDPAQRAS
jgi:hypothetical protein